MTGVSKWENSGPHLRLTAEDLSAVPENTRRTFDCGGVLIAMYRRPDGYWQVTPRRVPPWVLSNLRSVERVRKRDTA